MHATTGSALISLVMFLSSAPASAADPLTAWFCKVLKAPFDPKSAFAAFPLEKLPVPVEERESDGKGDPSVEYEAEGETYAVRFSYSIDSDDVNKLYGHWLQVRLRSGGARSAIESEKWLMQFGEPKEGPLGLEVGSAERLYAGGPPLFVFRTTPFMGDRSASWWAPGDVRYAAEICAKVK